MLKARVRRLLGDRSWEILKGVRDYWLRPGLESGCGGPFNGQDRRRELYEALMYQCQFSAIVETGTFRGTTTEQFARSGLPVYTSEASYRSFAYARRRLRRFRNVKVFRADSREFLKGLTSESDVPRMRVFFYLDAHWGSDLPLEEEVQIVLANWMHSIVMIDDFQVPDDAGYGFDDYGAGKQLTLGYLDCVTSVASCGMFFPAAPSTNENGRKRGCVVLSTSPETRELLNCVTELREWSRIGGDDTPCERGEPVSAR